jgi:hypothetical protein
MNCPHCKQPLPPNIVDTRHAGSKGGKVKSPLKARSSEQARAAINARWAKRRADPGTNPATPPADPS